MFRRTFQMFHKVDQRWHIQEVHWRIVYQCMLFQQGCRLQRLVFRVGFSKMCRLQNQQPILYIYHQLYHRWRWLCWRMFWRCRWVGFWCRLHWLGWIQWSTWCIWWIRCKCRIRGDWGDIGRIFCIDQQGSLLRDIFHWQGCIQCSIGCRHWGLCYREYRGVWRGQLGRYSPWKCQRHRGIRGGRDRWRLRWSSWIEKRMLVVVWRQLLLLLLDRNWSKSN